MAFRGDRGAGGPPLPQYGVTNGPPPPSCSAVPHILLFYAILFEFKT